MKLPLLLSMLALFAAGGPLFATDEMATEVPLTRYQAMIDKSPFAPATPPPAPVSKEATASFAQDFYIAGMAQLSSGDFVTISSKDAQQRFSLQVGESFSGMTLTSVTWSKEVGKSKATLKRGNEFGEIGFDEATLQASAAPANAQPQGAAPQPAARHLNPNGTRPIFPGAVRRRPPVPQQPGRPFRSPNAFQQPGVRQPTHIQSRVRSRVIPNAPQ